MELKPFLKENKPSAILLECVQSMKATENKGIKIRMDSWVDVTPKGKVCSLCAAGAYAVAKITNLVPIEDERSFHKLNQLTTQSDVPLDVMYAIDYLRDGSYNIARFKKCLNIPVDVKMEWIYVNYEKDKEEFYTQFKSWAKELKKQGY